MTEQKVKFGEVLSRCPEDERTRISAVLALLMQQSVACARMCENIESEEQVTAMCWKSLIIGMLDAEPAEVPRRVTTHIRANTADYQLAGAEAHGLEGESLSRLVGLPDFVYAIVEQDPDGMLPEQIEAYLRRQVFERQPVDLPAWLKALRLGRYILWGAVGVTTPAARDATDALCCRCGLPVSMEHAPVVFLRYVLPGGVVPHVPTFLDAYGGWPWPIYYRSARWVDGAYQGMTEPRPECSEQGGFVEVVSLPVEFTCLSEPVRFFE